MNNLLGNKFTLLTLFLNESFVLLGFFSARMPGKQDPLNLSTVTSLFSGEEV